MIKCTIGTNTKRTAVMVNPADSIKSVLNANGIDYSYGNIHLDGLTISGQDLEKSFAEHGVTDACYLISVVKSDGGLN